MAAVLRPNWIYSIGPCWLAVAFFYSDNASFNPSEVFNFIWNEKVTWKEQKWIKKRMGRAILKKRIELKNPRKMSICLSYRAIVRAIVAVVNMLLVYFIFAFVSNFENLGKQILWIWHLLVVKKISPSRVNFSLKHFCLFSLPSWLWAAWQDG